jgi:hypothetical protein
MIRVTQQHPRYEANYGPGWIGFISRRHEFVAAGIDWFSRWDEISHIPISHVFNLAGQDLTIEAFEKGVSDGSLYNYLTDPDVALLVRRPRGLSPAFARAIVAEAEKRLDEPYNNRLIVALAASETFLGHWLNKITNGHWEKFLCRRAARPDEWICSQLVATTLLLTMPAAAYGVLTLPPYIVKPIDLFEDLFAFEPGAVELVPPGHPLDNRS